MLAFKPPNLVGELALWPILCYTQHHETHRVECAIVFTIKDNWCLKYQL